MATIIIRRGTTVSLPTLRYGELAFTSDNKKVLVGDGVSNIIINPDIVNAAYKLNTSRLITLSGDVAGSASFDGSADATISVTLSSAFARLSSPTFTGTPSAPTATATTNTTQLATTAFVHSAITNDIPWNSTISNSKMNGSQSAGSLSLVARADHVHPIDTSRAPTASPTFTGTVTLPTSTPTQTLEAAAKGYVDYAINVAIGNLNGCMIFKGTLGTGGTVTALPTTGYKTGWSYRVITNGTYAAQACEVGDMVICVKDYVSSYADSDWTVVQTNEDGVVTSASALTSGYIVAGNGSQAVVATSITTASASTAIAETNSVSVTAGTYPKITFNAKGRVTGGSALADGDIPSTIARLASPALTGTPTAPTATTATSTTQLSTTAFVHAAIDAFQPTVSTMIGTAASGCNTYTDNAVTNLLANDKIFHFIGTIGTGGTVTALPTTGYKSGYVWRVITDGTYAGQQCYIGDLIICVNDYVSAFTNTDFEVIPIFTIDGGTF